jgi:hypothetical protein
MQMRIEFKLKSLSLNGDVVGKKKFDLSSRLSTAQDMQNHSRREAISGVKKNIISHFMVSNLKLFTDMAAWRSGHHSLMRNRRSGFESGHFVRFFREKHSYVFV